MSRDPENNLISILGPEFWLMVRVPRELLELPDYEQLQEVGRIARDHYEKIAFIAGPPSPRHGRRPLGLG